MKQNVKIQTMVIAALLCATGIMIPMFMPKIILGPASFTLASHLPIFLAMFISPPVALSVAVITGFGFLVAGFPLVIVLRALSHVGFVLLGALWVKKQGSLLLSAKATGMFGLVTGLVHAVCEVAVVTLFYFGNSMSEATYVQGYLVSVILLVGVGTLIHSMVDFGLSVFVWKHLQSVIHIPVCAKSDCGCAKKQALV